MLGMLVVSHGRLAEEWVEALNTLAEPVRKRFGEDE
jgi:mannose/fructose-specific phosphotransferase system component IIA